MISLDINPQFQKADPGTYGPGTFYPFGLTMAQLISATVETESLAYNFTGGGGNGLARTAPTFPLTSIQNKLAQMQDLSSGPLFDDTIGGAMTGDAGIEAEGGGSVLLGADGLFYFRVEIRWSDNDATSSSGAVSTGGFTIVGTCSFWGVMAPMYLDFGTPSGVSVDIKQATAFP